MVLALDAAAAQMFDGGTGRAAALVDDDGGYIVPLRMATSEQDAEPCLRSEPLLTRDRRNGDETCASAPGLPMMLP